MRLARRLLLAAWAGLLVTIGGVVAPALFAVLADRHLAGVIAGSLFRIATVISAGLATVLVLLALRLPERAARRGGARVALAAIVLLASESLVRPMLEAARAAGGASGSAFGAWHAVSSGLYWAATVWVVVELIRELRA